MQLRIATSVPCDFSPISYILSTWQVNHVVPEREMGAQLEKKTHHKTSLDKTKCSQNVLGGDFWQLKKQLGIFQKSKQQWRGLRLKLPDFLGASHRVGSKSVPCIRVVLEEATADPDVGEHTLDDCRLGHLKRNVQPPPSQSQEMPPHTQRLWKLAGLRHPIQPGRSPAGVCGDSCAVGRSFVQSLGKRTHWAETPDLPSWVTSLGGT